LCWHPNTDGQILLFPPRGQENPVILKRLLTEIPIPPAGIRIARVKKHSKTPPWLRGIKGTDERTIRLVPVQEHALDWRYPVRVLSSEVISGLKGHDFMRVRNYVRQAQRQNLQVERLKPSHKADIIGFAYRWANRRTEDFIDLINLTEPYREILNLADDESFNLDGLVLKLDGHVQAVTIWERPNTRIRVANSWVNLSNSAIKGISEFMTLKIAETLWAENVPYFNVGGSETRSLDDYKKKYMPVYSVDLQSVEAVVDGTDFVLESLLRLGSFEAASLVDARACCSDRRSARPGPAAG
jgi:Phosphatidylglycerol lysyltransferase, C-terminal